MKGDPKLSPRWNELVGVVDECELAVSFATEFAESIVAAVPEAQPAERVACVRGRASELPPGDIGVLIEVGTKGGEVAGGREAQSKVDALLSECGIDVAALRANVNGRGNR